MVVVSKNVAFASWLFSAWDVSVKAAFPCLPINIDDTPNREQCRTRGGHGVRRKFHVSEVLPANVPEGVDPYIVVGNEDNMCIPDDLELGGIFWMSSHSDYLWEGKSGGNPLDEYMVSLAGSTVNSSEYPLMMTAPTSRKGQWSWGASVAGHFLENYYAQSSTVWEHQRFEWWNSTMGRIMPVAKVFGDEDIFLIQKHPDDPNRWIRRNFEKKKGHKVLEDAEYIYTLVRIVYPNGTAVPTHFDNFIEYMTDKKNFIGLGQAMPKMYTNGYDDDCMRKCELGYTTRWMSCGMCARKCEKKENILACADLESAPKTFSMSNNDSHASVVNIQNSRGSIEYNLVNQTDSDIDALTFVIHVASDTDVSMIRDANNEATIAVQGQQATVIGSPRSARVGMAVAAACVAGLGDGGAKTVAAAALAAGLTYGAQGVDAASLSCEGRVDIVVEIPFHDDWDMGYRVRTESDSELILDLVNLTSGEEE